jgi:hypothetical protein
MACRPGILRRRALRIRDCLVAPWFPYLFTVAFNKSPIYILCVTSGQRPYVVAISLDRSRPSPARLSCQIKAKIDLLGFAKAISNTRVAPIE